MNEFIVYTNHGAWTCPVREATFWASVNGWLVKYQVAKPLSIMVCKVSHI